MDRIVIIKMVFFVVAVVGFLLIMMHYAKEQKKNCDYDMEILTVDCLLKRNAEQLKQMEQADFE